MKNIYLEFILDKYSFAINLLKNIYFEDYLLEKHLESLNCGSYSAYGHFFGNDST